MRTPQSNLQDDTPWPRPGDHIAIRQRLALIRDRLAHHLDRAGAAVLLSISIDLTLAGGSSTVSYSDLTARLGCARASIAQARRLGESLGLLRCAPGARVDGRPGPAPLTWSLLLPAGHHPISSAGEPMLLATGQPSALEGSTACTTATATSQQRGPEQGVTGCDGQPVPPDQDQRSERFIGDGTMDQDRDWCAALINTAAVRTGEHQHARMERALRPLLTALATRGWSLADVQALLAEAMNATMAYRPAHPTAYLMTVLRQRLSWQGLGVEDAPPGDNTTSQPGTRLHAPGGAPPPTPDPEFLPRQPVGESPGQRALPQQPSFSHEPVPASASYLPASRPVILETKPTWQPTATIPGLPCSPAAALQAACGAGGLVGEAFLRGATLAGWMPEGHLLVATAAPIPAGIATRLQPRLERGLSELLGRRVACRLVLASELGGPAAEEPDTNRPAAVPQPLRRLTG